MYTKIFAIDTRNLPQKDVQRIFNAFTLIIGENAGVGSTNQFRKSLDIQKSDIFRVLLGVPESWLTEQRQTFFETLVAYALKKPLGKNPALWTNEPNWRVDNSHSVSAPFDELILDTDFIQSFGLKQSTWEKEIFKSTGVFQRNNEGNLSNDQKLCLHIALGMFGFSEPSQFFTTHL